MKLGVSYNVFDAEEHLENSIKLIRNNVEYICVIYQTISNYGNKSNDSLVDLLTDLKNKKLVDEIYEYKPSVEKGGGFNETTKRNIGLYLCEKNGCTHHMSMDTDEFYLENEFFLLKEEMKNNNYDSSFCNMISYYNSTEYIRYPFEDYYVSLIYKIRKNKNFIYGYPCPVEIDPARRMDAGNYRIFNRDEIQMHHLSMIRNDIKSKLENSSAKVLFQNKITEIVENYKNWEYPKKALWPGNPTQYVEIKKVENLFK
jgi:hypothetical protein